MTCPLLEFHDVTVAYGRRPVLWNIDLTIAEPCLCLARLLPCCYVGTFGFASEEVRTIVRWLQDLRDRQLHPHPQADK